MNFRIKLRFFRVSLFDRPQNFSMGVQSGLQQPQIYLKSPPHMQIGKFKQLNNKVKSQFIQHLKNSLTREN